MRESGRGWTPSIRKVAATAWSALTMWDRQPYRPPCSPRRGLPRSRGERRRPAPGCAGSLHAVGGTTEPIVPVKPGGEVDARWQCSDDHPGPPQPTARTEPAHPGRWQYRTPPGTVPRPPPAGAAPPSQGSSDQRPAFPHPRLRLCQPGRSSRWTGSRRWLARSLAGPAAGPPEDAPGVPCRCRKPMPPGDIRG